MHIIISHTKTSSTASPFTSHAYQDQVFLDKQKDLRQQYCEGKASLNDIMEDMYLLGKQQGQLSIKKEI